MKNVLLLKKKCPVCEGTVIWSMNNLEIGASSVVTCSNNASTSRIDWVVEGAVICEWTGKVVRMKDGSFQFFS